jgi:type IV pilus assembly protein PilB
MKQTKTTRRTKVTSATQRANELVGMKEAIAMLGTTQPTFYRWLREGRLKGLKAGRQWRFKRGEIERFLKGEPPPSAETPGLECLVATLRERLKGVAGKAPPRKGDLMEQAVSLLMLLGRALGASDIHLEPADPEGRIRYRVDGVLVEYAKVHRKVMEPLAENLMTLCHCNVQRKGVPQDGRLRMTMEDTELDIRMCFLPALDGTTVTARLLDPTGVSLTLDRLPLLEQHRDLLMRKLERPYGLVLVAGPTGSGKTTTLYACLHHLNKPGVKVMTIEDPVEFRIPGTVQMRTREGDGMTFEHAVRGILRSDPDVMMIAEIRSPAIAGICHQAALTGHMVLTAIHCQSAPSTLRRLMDLNVLPWVVAESVVLVVAQRLMRRVCPHCSRRVDPPAGELARARRMVAEGGLDWAALPHEWKAAVGCAECRQLGYRGRLSVNEMLPVEGAVQAAVMAGATADELAQAAREDGHASLAAEMVHRAARGETTLAEALRMAATLSGS